MQNKQTVYAGQGDISGGNLYRDFQHATLLMREYVHVQCYVVRCRSEFLDHILTTTQSSLIDVVRARQAV